MIARLLATSLLLASIPALGQGYCTLSSEALAFPPHPAVTNMRSLATDTLSSTQFTVTCSGIARGGPYRVLLLPSAGDGGARFLRHLGGGVPMNIALFKDGSLTQPWGDGTSGGTPITGVISPGDSRQMHVVFGRIRPGQTRLRAGSYESPLSVRLEYTP